MQIHMLIAAHGIPFGFDIYIAKKSVISRCVRFVEKKVDIYNAIRQALLLFLCTAYL